MPNIEIWKEGAKLATGTAAQGSATISAIARVQERVTPSVRRIISNWSAKTPTPDPFAGLGRNITVLITSGTSLGRTYAAKVLADSGIEGQTLTLDAKCPYL